MLICAQDLSLGAMSAASSVSEMQVSNVAEESNASTASTAAAAAGPIQQSAAAVPPAGPSTAASDSQPGPSRAAAAGPQHQGSSGQRSVSFTVSPKKAFMMRDQAAREATSGASALSVVGSSSAQPHCKT